VGEEWRACSHAESVTFGSICAEVRISIVHVMDAGCGPGVFEPSVFLEIAGERFCWDPNLSYEPDAYACVIEALAGANPDQLRQLAAHLRQAGANLRGERSS
jgi:hypothetical protein